MVNKKISTRDYLRNFITKANKVAGVNFNSSKLNNKEECEEYILKLIKDLKNKPVTKSDTDLKYKIKKQEAEILFYMTQIEEARKKREKTEKEHKELSIKYNNLLVEATKLNKSLTKWNKFLMITDFLMASSMGIIGIFIIFFCLYNFYKLMV